MSNDMEIRLHNARKRRQGYNLKKMIDAWADYAQNFKHLYDDENGISTDGYAGEDWEKMGEILKSWLNMEIGDLNAGEMDTFIRETLKKHGAKVDD